MKFKNNSQRRSFRSVFHYFLIFFLILIVVCAIFAKKTYDDNLRPVSSVSKKIPVNIDQGESVSQIASDLKAKSLIKNKWAFECYVRSKKAGNKIQAGTYQIDQNQSVSDIVEVLKTGKVATDLVTILPGKNLNQIKAGFLKAGYSQDEINTALSADQYRDHPVLSELPAGASLEGYLFPETFQKTSTTKLSEIIRLSLDELQTRLTPEVRQAITKQDLNLHQALSLASIVENESPVPNDRSKVASVFYNRLKLKMKLESNATDEYSKDNPAYNTYKIDGLPPGPISNMSQSSIFAVANPANTDYLFFVSADDRKTTYFSKTVEEHNDLVRKYCKQNCAPH